MEAEPKEAEVSEVQSEAAPPPETDTDLPKDKLQQIHISKILDEVLETSSIQPAPGERAYKHPMFLDFALACGLLLAMCGFTIGMMKIYMNHQAKQAINQHKYKDAIEILKSAPFPGWFVVEDNDPHETLAEAYYLDAAEKLDENGDDPIALRELGRIPPGSQFFKIAQQAIKEHTRPSDIMLEGKTEHEANPNDVTPPDNTPILPPEPKDASP